MHQKRHANPGFACLLVDFLNTFVLEYSVRKTALLLFNAFDHLRKHNTYWSPIVLDQVARGDEAYRY